MASPRILTGAALLASSAFVPPVAQPAPPPPPVVQGQGATVEARTVRADARAGFTEELGAYIFARPWTAADVYVDVSEVTGAWEMLSIFVYAISQQGGRVLAASGRMLNPDGSSPYGVGQDFLPISAWVAAARGPVQERYEVVFRFDGVVSPPGAVTIAGQVIITCVGSDKAVAPPPTLGAIVTGPRLAFVQKSIPVKFEVLRAWGVRDAAEFNNPALPRYLLLLDNSSTGLNPQESPIAFWYIPANGPSPDALPLGAARLQVPRLVIGDDPTGFGTNSQAGEMRMLIR